MQIYFSILEIQFFFANFFGFQMAESDLQSLRTWVIEFLLWCCQVQSGTDRTGKNAEQICLKELLLSQT
jgi:hypothetical protein